MPGKIIEKDFSLPERLDLYYIFLNSINFTNEIIYSFLGLQ